MWWVQPTAANPFAQHASIRGQKDHAGSDRGFPKDFVAKTRDIQALQKRRKTASESAPPPVHRLRERILVSTAAVYDGNRDLQHAEVNRQLPAVVIPVVEHDGP